MASRSEPTSEVAIRSVGTTDEEDEEDEDEDEDEEDELEELLLLLQVEALL